MIPPNRNSTRGTPAAPRTTSTTQSTPTIIQTATSTSVTRTISDTNVASNISGQQVDASSGQASTATQPLDATSSVVRQECQMLIDYQNKDLQRQIAFVKWSAKWFRIITDITNGLIHVSKHNVGTFGASAQAALLVGEENMNEFQFRRQLDRVMENFARSMSAMLNVTQTGDMEASNTVKSAPTSDSINIPTFSCTSKSVEKFRSCQTALRKAWNAETDYKVQLVFRLQRDFSIPLKYFLETDIKPLMDMLLSFEKKRLKLIQAQERLFEIEETTANEHAAKKDRMLKKQQKKVDDRRTQCEMDLIALEKSLQYTVHQITAFFAITTTDLLDMQLRYHKHCLTAWNEAQLAFCDVLI